MKCLLLLVVSMLLSVATPETQARSFRSMQAIVQPGAAPAGASPVTAIEVVDRVLVEQAVHDVARAWNSGELSELLADDFASRTRLEDTIAEVVPRGAVLTVIGIQAVSTLDQFRQADGTLLSTVSAVVRSQIEFDDPLSGHQRLESSGEWVFRVTHAKGDDGASDVSAATPPLVAEREPGGPLIDQVLPPSRRWDSQLTITGSNFGAPGRILVYLQGAGAPAAVPYDAIYWSENAVTAAIREDSLIAQLVLLDTEPRSATVWICPGMTEIPDLPTLTGECAGKAIIFLPTAAMALPARTPTISDLEPRSVSPGTTFRVTGTNFGTVAGSVVVNIGDREITPTDVSWSESEVNVTLPSSLAGLTAQEGIITLTNEHRREAAATFDFVPRLAFSEFTATVAIDSDGYVDCHKEGDALDFVLINDWRVTGTYSSSHTATRHATFMPGSTEVSMRVLDEPRAGSDNPRVRFWCSARNGAAGLCSVTVQVRGPAGTVPAYEGSTTAPRFPMWCMRTGLHDWERVED